MTVRRPCWDGPCPNGPGRQRAVGSTPRGDTEADEALFECVPDRIPVRPRIHNRTGKCTKNNLCGPRLREGIPTFLSLFLEEGTRSSRCLRVLERGPAIPPQAGLSQTRAVGKATRPPEKTGQRACGPAAVRTASRGELSPSRLGRAQSQKLCKRNPNPEGEIKETMNRRDRELPSAEGGVAAERSEGLRRPMPSLP